MTSVKIFYGPYEAHGVIRHRIQKLRGLLQYLEGKNYDVEVVKVNYLNTLSIEMCDRQIFIANIRNFKFNIDWQDDVVCNRAINAITEAESRMMYHQKLRCESYTYADESSYDRLPAVSFGGENQIKIQDEPQDDAF